MLQYVTINYYKRNIIILKYYYTIYYIKKHIKRIFIINYMIIKILCFILYTSIIVIL
jgi:hypothetical protein